jgi:hypothetical protein
MVDRPEESTEERRGSAYAKTKRLFAASASAIALGLGIAGTFDRDVGGAVLLGGWLLGIASLHRLGRAGSSPRSETTS